MYKICLTPPRKIYINFRGLYNENRRFNIWISSRIRSIIQKALVSESETQLVLFDEKKPKV
jgi:hypothetical protein